MVDPLFWQTKTLQEMSDEEWEAVCDGCGKCCLNTFIDSEDEDDFAPTDKLREGETLLYTNIVCRYLDSKNCQCTEYARRQTLVPSCVKLTRDNIKDIFFMPPSCSYRRLQEGRGLAEWHPLLNKGKKSKMHAAGISVRGKVVSDADVDLEYFEDHIADWPLKDTD